MWITGLLACQPTGLGVVPGPEVSDDGGTVTVDVGGCESPVAQTVVRPTWDDVGPILAANCLGCHGAGSIAGIPLDTYEDAALWAEAIASATADRRMPPFPARNCASCSTYRDAAWLDDTDIATLVAWAADGAPAGEGPTDAVLEPETVLHLGDEATVTVPLPEYTPDASQDDEFRCFVLDAGLPEDRYVTAFEVLPDQLQEVHHILLYALDAAGDATALGKDAESPTVPGYSCFGSPGVPGAMLMGGWGPGTGRLDYPATTGVKLEAGRKMVAFVHYNTLNGVTPDRSRIALKLEESVERRAWIAWSQAKGDLLPPNEPAVQIEHHEVLWEGSSTVWGVAGHMHERGTSIQISSSEGFCGLDIPKWDFDWQYLYFFDQPYVTAPGEAIDLKCTYDTTDADAPIPLSEGTGNEMCLSFLYVTVP